MSLLAVAAAFAASVLAVAGVRRWAERLPHAYPGARTLHQRPVPRVGGLAILAGTLAAVAVEPPGLPGAPGVWMASVAAVVAISLADDFRGVAPAVRLAVHLAASVALGMALFGAGAWGVAAALAIAWGANLYNFMDGSDGLAATMAVVGFGAYAAASAHAAAPWTLAAAIAVSALPFLAVNRPPASMFMGDVGSVPLGLLAAALGCAGVAAGHWAAWFPLLVFLPFLADATATLALRAWRRERVWEAHRSHFYQRLHLAGAGHRGTLALYAADMLACALLALACAVARPQAGWLALAVAVTLHAIGFLAIVYHVGNNKARGTSR
jgi:UDP-N-acetylmuramyl pentapeptide phosphotransferase/UDP-N-acetylglucosamine-1-phosphate transferase